MSDVVFLLLSLSYTHTPVFVPVLVQPCPVPVLVLPRVQLRNEDLIPSARPAAVRDCHT